MALIDSRFKDELLARIEQMRAYAKSSSYIGYDPYDVMEHPLSKRLLWEKQPLPLKPFSVLYAKFIYNLPAFSRAILHIHKRRYAKAMGLFASAYLRLYEITNKKGYLDDAEECLSWLKENPSRGYSGICWGYPFDWMSCKVIPRLTPSSVVTTTIGFAFLKHYEITADKSSLDICNSIASFLLNDLNVDEIDSDRLCFSYTPLDKFHVHNANLMTAEFLFAFNSYRKEPVLIDYATKSLEYTLREQGDNGSFEYWGLTDRKETHIDFYHTGFVLRSLYHIYKLTGNSRVKVAFERGLKFFMDNFFFENREPKFHPNRKLPIDIHSIAEAILSLSIFYPDYPEVGDYLINVYHFSDEQMWDKKGYYYYRIKRCGRLRIPYIRWSQAWMIRALSEFLGVVVA